MVTFRQKQPSARPDRNGHHVFLSRFAQLLLPQARHDQPYFFETDLRRKGLFQRFQPLYAEARAGELDTLLFVALDPAALEFQFAFFHQVSHQAYHAGQLPAANSGNFFKGPSFREQAQSVFRRS